MDYLFSIVVPVYNIEKYLPTCINSIIHQTYDNFELILVDDGSTDNSGTICDNYAHCDSRIKVIHKNNGGLVSARKEGAKIAEGEYIVCVDGDDWISLDYLEKTNEAIQIYTPDMLVCGYISSSDSQQLDHPFPYKSGFYDSKQIRSTFYPCLIQGDDAAYFRPHLWAKVIKKSIYLKHQMAVPNELTLGEDFACVIPCIVDSNSLYILDGSFYYYRCREDSITHDKKAFDWNGPRYIYKCIAKQIDLDSYDFQQQLYRKVTHELFNVAVSQFNQHASYLSIKKDVLTKLEEPLYKSSVNETVFSKSLKAIMMNIVMKKRLILVLFIYNRLLA